MIRHKQGTPLHITWDDICSNTGWHDPNKKHSLFVVESVGMLLKQDKRTVTIVQSHAMHDHDVADALTIPWVNIKKIKKLK